MSQTPTSDGADRTGASNSTSRRTFMQAAAAGVTAAGVGATGLAGSAGAQESLPTPPLSVDGNVFVDPEGNTVTLRGVNIIDPRRADVLAPTRGKNAVQMVDNVTERSEGWATRVVRVPLQPSDIAESTTGYQGGPATPGAFSDSDLETYLADHVDDVVDRCEERGAYVILDYHRHWTNSSSEGENPEFDGKWGDSQGGIREDLQQEVVDFWDVVADRYGDRDHTLFEVYNEPTEPGMWGDPIDSHWAGTWFQFVEFVQPMVDQIAEHTDNPQLLGSPSWTQSPEGILLTEEDTPDYMSDDFNQLDEPENLAMTYHIYPGHQASQGQDWSDDSSNGDSVGKVYEEYPLFVTEFGWDDTLGAVTPSNPLPGTTSGFGDPFVEWMESDVRAEAVNWTAWCADIWWDPTMFNRGFEGTDTSFENPYTADVPQDCPELPCEWNLLGEDEGDYDTYMGARMKEALAEHNDLDFEPTGPSSPSNVSTSNVGETSVDVAWDSVSDADTYNVYLDGSVEDSTSSTSYTIEGLTAGTQYEIGVAAENADGESSPTTTTVTTTGGGACEDAAASETLEDGSTVCDVDGDGEYRDVTGDGAVTNSDVTEFFGNQHADPWDSRSDLFDFTGDDDVTQADVIELFSSVN